MNLVCLSVDHLHAGYLGCYGNTWIATPQLDRLASESFLLDQFHLDAPSMQGAHESYWTGRHSLEPVIQVPTLPEAATASGARSILLTDEPELLKASPLSDAFDDRIPVDSRDAGESAKSADT
ncbi:MAG: sulfatase-like hydrolase/transferase, partial [Planctomycetales bacterium]